VGKRVVGIIGGTGLGATLARKGFEPVYVDTAFGPPSGPLCRGNWQGVDVVFLNRHGEGHHLSPSNVPYRANIFALKAAGVDCILASGAVGSLREEYAPGHLVVCDQAIDKTFRRPGTFFDRDLVAHVELADPFCPDLRELLVRSGADLGLTVHPKGTYVVMEGPQFSTRAEAHLHRQWGGDLIGMTCMPEAKLAREAELCYALVALVTDYDCWRPHEAASGTALLEEILGNLQRASDNCVRLIEAVLPRIASAPQLKCRCGNALELAIWSDKSRVPRETVERLRPLVGRYLPERTS
jgi:5'-methylthioadenosine phosphorylase